MSNILKTIKPNIFTSTFMFWGLLSCLNILNMHNAMHTSFAFFVSVSALAYGITSIVQITKFCRNMASNI